MEIENLSLIEILDSGEMYLVLASGGKPSYQYIYREASEVYWDSDRKAFKAPSPREWSHADWFHHIIKVAAQIGIALSVTKDTCLVNVPKEIRDEMGLK
ncbi:hypothetical protein FE810_16960 [Thalassotalea litorea]|uniref:Integron Cassette Protein Hfx-Cass5 domain-containing protein n=1 Tax=Thalassotalea litorea TaxID=2020715 RepID=A0A5R9IE04_9GAMM|nr:hypothetical protein [Thalassotalea litorea]TLU59460.1 hypothetical protein FE810_16960 [Thalassotalea litorea]